MWKIFVGQNFGKWPPKMKIGIKFSQKLVYHAEQEHNYVCLICGFNFHEY